ncbi:MAG: DUF177 domain-containing protein [Dehalococcoidia bacterium]|nr:DUF177 domain-containing protein [Dehalococcoidia bacterium]
MQINVAQMLKQGIGSSYSYRIKPPLTGEEAEHSVSGEVELIRTDKGVLVRGTLYTQRSLVCSRCLRIFDYPIIINIDDEYLPLTDEQQGIPLYITEDSEGFTIDQFNVLDLTKAVSQYTLFNTPINPLCHPDCAGLCPKCGADLNQSRCSCAQGTGKRSDLIKI